jgi:hypothetical protein
MPQKMKMSSAAAAPLILLLLALATGAGAVRFGVVNRVPDSAGGQRFDRDYGGVAYAKQVLSEASSFIWTTFNEPSPEDRRDYEIVVLEVVEDLPPGLVAQTSRNAIQLRAQSVADADVNNIKEWVS